MTGPSLRPEQTRALNLARLAPPGPQYDLERVFGPETDPTAGEI